MGAYGTLSRPKPCAERLKSQAAPKIRAAYERQPRLPIATANVSEFLGGLDAPANEG